MVKKPSRYTHLIQVEYSNTAKTMIAHNNRQYSTQYLITIIILLYNKNNKLFLVLFKIF